jgi:putative transposase
MPLHHRKQLRLHSHDYAAPGDYFITANAHRRQHLFAFDSAHGIQLTPAGHIIQRTWDGLPHHYHGIEFDAIVIMPDHIHCIIRITTHLSQWNHTLFDVIGSLKSFAAREINILRHTPGAHVWQRSYYDRIGRAPADLDGFRIYMAQNPIRWHQRHWPNS